MILNTIKRNTGRNSKKGALVRRRNVTSPSLEGCYGYAKGPVSLWLALNA